MTGFSSFGCVLLTALLLTLACDQKSPPSEESKPGAERTTPAQDGRTEQPSATPGVTPGTQPAASVPAPSTGTQAAPPQVAGGPPRVELLVGQGGQDWGRIVIELNPEKAPITTKNFLRYVEEGFYDGTIFHRVMPDFMIQGGGFTNLDQEKTEGLHEPIQNESKDGLKNERGTIAMARLSRRPHSATAQFFINVKDNPSLNHPSFDGWGYAVFGRVVDGMDVVDRIKEVETRPNPANPQEKSQPVDPPVIRKAQVVK